MRRKRAAIVLGMSCILMASAVLQGCQQNSKSGKVEIELVQYKPEAVDIFEQLEKEFNETHDDIHLKISSPNDATTILKTRFIREDYPDIIGIGGDINYSYFVDSGILADLSDYEGLSEVKPAYLDIIEGLEFVPTEGTYGLPYVANAAGVLYNKDMFAEHGWEIPQTWDEFISLCEEIQNEGIQPLYFGYKDTWTCLAPWNALAVGLAPSDVCQQVNKGETTFSKEYPQVSPYRKPAAKKSPAPVVSTTFATGTASTRTSSVPLRISEPRAPTFTMAILHILAIISNASSGSLPVNAFASSSLAKTISTYLFTSKEKNSWSPATML